MPLNPPETSTPPRRPPRGSAALHPLEARRRIPGRNRSKADIVVCDSPVGRLAVKDYGARSWWVRNSLGRILARREAAAYRRLAGLTGLARFHGRLGPFALALGWIEARRLADLAEASVDPAVFDALDAIVAGIHGRGVALCDLSYRDVLVGADGSVHVVDLAASWIEDGRLRGLRRRLFERFRAADRFALARLRARFAGGDPRAAERDAGPDTLAWHRRARRLKWRWDRLRGAERLPPVHDHWRH